MKRINVGRSRHLREDSTHPEQMLWRQLRNRQICKTKFRRQHQIGPYITDFCCIEKRLVIEVDGDTHGYEKQEKYDEKRTEFLQQEGYQVVRFTNRDVTNNLAGVIERLFTILSPSP